MFPRAWIDTATFFGWKWRSSVIVLLGLYLAGFLALSAYKGRAFAVDETISNAFLSLIPLGVFAVMVFVFNLIMAPARLAEEVQATLKKQDEQIRDLEALVSGHGTTVQGQLVAFIREGNFLASQIGLRRQQPMGIYLSMDLATQLAGWSQRVFDYLNQNLPEYAAGFATQPAHDIFGAADLNELQQYIKDRVGTLGEAIRGLR